MGRHPVDVLKAALQEAKTEAATLRIKTATLAEERNAAILERNEARRELAESRKLGLQENTELGEARRRLYPLEDENTSLKAALAAWYGLSVPCDRCGSPAWTPCITDTGRFTVHSPRVTKAVAAIPADDSLTPEGASEGTSEPEPCPPSSVTGKACLLPPGHPPDSPTRFHRYAGPGSEARIRELEAEVQRLQQDRAQIGAFGFRPMGIR